MEEKTEPLDLESENEDKSKTSTLKSEIFGWVKAILLAIVIAFVINHFILINAVIPSASMENTIMTNDRIFGFRLAYLFDEPERYDIVIFPNPDGNDSDGDGEIDLYIKRIIGMPGETLEIVEGEVYIDGSPTPLDSSFTPEQPLHDFGPIDIPENSYFMMGDNRNHSSDAREWEDKFVEEDEILGKAIFRYYKGFKLFI